MKEYFKETIKADRPSLIVFLRAGDQDAESVKELAEAIEQKYDGRVAVERVDVSYNHEVANEFHVNRYPCWVLFCKGEELMRESGNKTLTELSEMVERAF